MIGDDRRPLILPLMITALIAASASLSLAQQPPMPAQGSAPLMGSIPKVPTTELTESSAKQAVDAYLILREKYGDKVPPANQSQAMAQGMKAISDIDAIVAGHGFQRATDWQKAITAVALAYGFSKDGKGAEMDQKIAELEANTKIPAAYKQQIIGSMKSLRPSANNLAIVETLLADPTYGAKIRSIGK